MLERTRDILLLRMDVPFTFLACGLRSLKSWSYLQVAIQW